MVVCAATQPMTRGNSALMSCVSSIPNIIAVRGERRIPPITPPMMRRDARPPPGQALLAIKGFPDREEATSASSRNVSISSTTAL